MLFINKKIYLKHTACFSLGLIPSLKVVSFFFVEFSIFPKRTFKSCIDILMCRKDFSSSSIDCLNTLRIIYFSKTEHKCYEAFRLGSHRGIHMIDTEYTYSFCLFWQ